MIQILLLAILPLAMAQYGGYGDNGYGNNGYGKIEESYPPQPYKFGYDINDSYGSNIQQSEEGDKNGNKRGSYSYTDGHGVARKVEYVADKNGFRAVIKTNEPGTADEDPADVKIESDAPKVEYKEEPRLYKSYESSGYGQPSYGDSYGNSESRPLKIYSRGY